MSPFIFISKSCHTAYVSLAHNFLMDLPVLSLPTFLPEDKYITEIQFNLNVKRSYLCSHRKTKTICQPKMLTSLKYNTVTACL